MTIFKYLEQRLQFLLHGCIRVRVVPGQQTRVRFQQMCIDLGLPGTLIRTVGTVEGVVAEVDVHQVEFEVDVGLDGQGTHGTPNNKTTTNIT